MKTLALICSFMFAFVVVAKAPENAYSFKINKLEGGSFSLKQYKGKKVLIVNTASKCGFVGQYADLQKLSELYKDKLVIVGFPENNFKNQEPGGVAEIKACTDKYNVTFPISEKVSVLGDDISPLFKYLTTAPNPDFTGDIKWNFEKFLVDENGNLIHRFRTNVVPTSEAITKYL